MLRRVGRVASPLQIPIIHPLAFTLAFPPPSRGWMADHFSRPLRCSSLYREMGDSNERTVKFHPTQIDGTLNDYYIGATISGWRMQLGEWKLRYTIFYFELEISKVESANIMRVNWIYFTSLIWNLINDFPMEIY